MWSGRPPPPRVVVTEGSRLGDGQPKTLQQGLGGGRRAPVASVERIRPVAGVPSPVQVSAVVTRVRRRLGLMLVLLASAAAVAGAALATLVAGQEAVAAIVAAAVMLAVTLVLVVAMLAERRALRRDAARDRVAPMAPAHP